MDGLILILDKLDYKSKEDLIRREIGNEDIKVYYTEYEDSLIRMVCKWKYIGELLQHIFYWIKSFNSAFEIYRKNKSGKIICINPIVGMFLGGLNGKKKFELIVGGFLFEPKKNKIYYQIRVGLTKHFLKGIKYAIVYAKKEVSFYERIFKVKKFRFVQYGIDYEAHHPYEGELPTRYIFSGGRSNRDFHTLIKAYEQLGEERPFLCIATRPVVLQGENTKNIRVLKDVVLETFGNVMEKSEFVVLPLVETDISAGHMVLLEALERNKIVIISDIDAVRDYVSEDEVLFYEPGNASSLKKIMTHTLIHYDKLCEKYSKNHEFYLRNYTFLKFVKRLVEY